MATKQTGYTAGTVTIANGESLSTEFITGGRRLVKLSVPTIDSATLSFQVKIDKDDEFRNLYDGTGAEVTVGSASTGARTFLVPELAGMYAIKVRSGTAGGAVNQGAARTIRVSASDIHA